MTAVGTAAASAASAAAAAAGAGAGAEEDNAAAASASAAALAALRARKAKRRAEREGLRASAGPVARASDRMNALVLRRQFDEQAPAQARGGRRAGSPFG